MRKIFFFLATLFSVVSIGQSRVTIKGIVLDKDGTPLISATCVALNPADSMMLGFGTTDNDGKFEIDRIKPGKITLQITYLGYGTFERPLEIIGDQKILDLGTIDLSPQTNVIEGAVVVGQYIPIVIKKDTVEYNADAFRVGVNATVEDLFKKLPGIEVDASGAITAQGEVVNTVLVDGKKFFGNDPKLATKNLPADAVKKIQVIDQKSDRSQFSGVDDGVREKVINLELKADKKVGVFGNIVGGYGNNERFDTKLSLNKFSGKYQAALLAGFNNVNKQGFSSSDYGTLTGTSGFGGGGGNPLVNFGGLAAGEVKSFSGGLNFGYDFTKKINLTTSYFLSTVDKLVTDNSIRENFLGAKNFFVDDKSIQDQSTVGHDLNMRFEAKPDSIQRFNFEFNYKNGQSNTLNNGNTLTLNSDQVLENSNIQTSAGDATNTNLSLNADYSIRLKKAGRIASISTNIGNTVIDNVSDLDQDKTIVRNSTSTLTKILQNQISLSDNNNYRFNVNYKEPLGKENYLDIGYSRRNFNTNRIKDFFDLDPTDRTVRTLNQLLSTLSDNTVVSDRIGPKWTKNAKNLNLNVDLIYQYSQIKGDFRDQPSLRKSFNYFTPEVGLNFPDTRLRFRYTTSVNEPSANQLQPIVDNTNPLNISTGNPELKPEYNHDFSVRYFLFDSYNFRNLFVNASYRLTQDNIITATTIDENFIRTSSPINFGNSTRSNASINYGTPLKPLRVKANVSLGGTMSQRINFINNATDNVTSWTPNTRIEIENLDNDVVSITASARYAYTNNSYTTNENLNASFLNQTYTVNGLINLGKGFNIESNFEYYYYSKERFGDNNTVALWNASVSKNVMKDRLNIKLYGFDLLKRNLGVSRNVGDTFAEQSVTNALQQYFMFSGTYRLSSFNPQQGRMGMPGFGGSRRG
jgi:hypothetical protein